MSKKDKLVQNILNNPKNVSFENLKKVLENDGYIGINKGGSHWVFRTYTPVIEYPLYSLCFFVLLRSIA